MSNFHSIKNILVNNRLIKGRLNISNYDIQKLFRSKQKLNDKILKELEQEEEIIKNSLIKIKKLKLDLRKIQETINKAFYPSYDNISLLYKRVGNNQYVKARFYWHGQQREVQVGSLEIILKIIRDMLKAGYLKKISVSNSNNMTWKKFIKNDDLILATKKIAALKFQEYVLRKISSDGLNFKKVSQLSENKNIDNNFKRYYSQKYFTG